MGKEVELLRGRRLYCCREGGCIADDKEVQLLRRRRLNVQLQNLFANKEVKLLRIRRLNFYR